MAKKNSPGYWEQRIASNTWNTYNSIEDQSRALLDLYQDANKSIRDALYTLAEKHSKNGVLTRSEIYKSHHLERLQKNYEDIIESIGKQTQENAAATMRQGFQSVYGNVREALGDIDFSLPNKKLMTELLEKPWRGNDFSHRLWANQKMLATTLNDQLRIGLQQGKTVTEIAVKLSNIMGSGFNEAHRLVRTETMHYLNMAALRGYKDSGVQFVQFWAAEDERTCPECRQYHGKIYPTNKAPILPIHPHCRCTYLPVVYEELTTDEQYALNKYISPDAYALNDKLRRGERLTAPDRKWIIDLNTALKKLPTFSGDLTRSLYFYDDQSLRGYLTTYRPGNRVCEKSYVSTTKGEIYNPDGQAQIHILNSNNGRDISMFNQSEQEVLYMPEAEFIVIDVRQLEGVYHIIMKEV